MAKYTIEVQSQWDTWNTTLLYSRLMSYFFDGFTTSKPEKQVKKGQVQFDLEAKKGAVGATFIIHTDSESSAKILLWETYQYVQDRIKRQKSLKTEQPPITIIDYKKRRFVLTGNKDIAPEKP